MVDICLKHIHGCNVTISYFYRHMRLLIAVFLLIITSLSAIGQTTWYSYQSGNWGNNISWTLDGATAPTYVNPDSKIPEAGDHVIIRNNHAITMRNADGSAALNSTAALGSLEIRAGATLDLQSTTGHDFTTIKGAGTIKLSGEFVDNGATDYYLENLPAGDYTDFADLLLGGTIQYNTGTNDIPLVLNNPISSVAGIELVKSDQTVILGGSTIRAVSRRSVINMGDANDRVILQRNIAQTGNLRITQGNFQIHSDQTEPFESDNGAPLSISNANLSLNINGNVIIETDGQITTGTATSRRHEFNLNGDFTNDGTNTTSFTQRTSQNTNSEANDGVVDLNFLNETKGQELICNGPTNIYRIEIDKGTQSVELSIMATESGGNSNFRLYGYARDGHPSNAQLTSNSNALGLISGAVRIGENVVIEPLNNTGNYNISESAALIVDGGFVVKTGGAALVPYGTIEVYSGTLISNPGSGITTRDAGTFRSKGGFTYISQFRTSVNGPSAVGGYEQTGGTVNVGDFTGITSPGGSSYNSSDPSGTYYTFSLTYTNNVFIMADGVLNVNEPSDNDQGSIFINSDPGNINVTGGTVNVTSTNDGESKITSRAPFYNLNILNSTTATNRKVVVGTGSSASETITTPDLVVLNDLTIETGTTRTSGSNTFGSYLDLCPNNTCSNLDVGRNLTIEDNAVLDIWAYSGGNNNGSSTITFTGSLPGTLYIGDITTYDNSLTEYIDPEGELAYERWELPFYNFRVEKNNTTLSLSAKNPEDENSSNFVTASGGKNVNGWRSNLIKVVNECFIGEGATLDQVDPNNSSVGYSFRIYGSSVTNNGNFFTYTNGVTPKGGVIKLRKDGGDITLNTTTGSVFGNIRLNSGGDLVVLSGDTYFKRLEYRHGRINLRTYNLKVDELDINMESGDIGTRDGSTYMFSSEDMLFTAGNASDGGLSLKVQRSAFTSYGEYVNGSDEYNDVDNDPPRWRWFPIGTNANSNLRYTPAICYINTPGTYDGDEYITVNPVDKELSTTDLAGGNILSYYWKVDFEGFEPGEEPEVSWLFQYNESDDDAGDEANFVPGKVLNGGTYQRSDEGSTLAVKDGGSGFNVFGNNNNGDILGDDPANIIIFNGIGSNGSPDANDDIDNGTADEVIRESGTTNVDDNWDQAFSIPSGFTLEKANYTAGAAARFVGSPTVYYSRAIDGNWWEWQSTNNWSTDPIDKHIGPPAGSYPSTGDIVNVGSEFVNSLTGGSYTKTGDGRHQIRIDNSVGDIDVAEIIFNSVTGGSALNVADMSRVRITKGRELNASVISGKGELVQDVGPSFPADFGTITADLGDFVSDSNNGWFFWIQNTGTTIVNDRSDYPTFRTFGADGDFQFGQSVTAQNALIDNGTVFQVANDLLVENTLVLGSNGEGYLEFINVGSNVLLECDSLAFIGDPNNSLSVENAGSDTHTLKVNGNIFLDDGNTFNLTSAGSNVILELSGTGTHALENNTAITMDLYKLVLDKGDDVTSSFTFPDNFNITDPATTGFQPVEILNGLLILDDPGIDIILTDASTGSFYLPNTPNLEASSGSGGIEIKQGIIRMNGNNTGMILDGPLVLSGGDADFIDGSNNTFIEYSASGNASISITNANSKLEVGSQIRRSTLSASGVLDLILTAGELEIGGGTNGVTSRAMLEIVNNGSSFTHTGGTIRFFRQNGNTSSDAYVASLFLEPGSSNISGTATIEIDLRNGDPKFAINSNVALNNLTLLSGGTDSGDEVVQLKTRSLTINGDLNVSDDIEFRTNNLDLTLNGDFSFNDDTKYTPGINTTTFSSSDAASLSANSTFGLSFYSFKKNGSGLLNLNNGDITITGANFDLSSGTLADNDHLINFSGQVMTNNAIHTSLTGGINKGIVFNSTSQQILTTDSEGQFGNITIDNSSGVSLPDFNQQFTIDSTLTLSQGILDIGPALLIFAENGKILNSLGEGNSFDDFSESVQIQTNSSIIDFGVQKTFSVRSNGIFFFPVGEATRYTPVLLNFNAPISTSGSIRVRPRNRIAPIMESELQAVQDKVLQYHWILNSDGFGNDFDADLTFNYDEEVIGSDETNYLGAIAFFGDPDLGVADGLGSLDAVNNTFTIPINLPIDTLSDPLVFSGEYFAGNQVDIPDEFSTFIFDNNAGDYSMTNIANYFQDIDSDGLRDSPGEDLAGNFASNIIGSAVKIGDGLTMTLDSAVTFSRLNITSTATLEIDYTNSDVFDLQLGQVSGSGTISIISDDNNAAIPPGDYNSFFTGCGSGGGALQYGGTGSYSILAETNRVRELTLTGSGSKTFPPNLVTICEDLIINDGSANLANGTESVPISVDILGNMLMQNGTVQFGENSVLDISGNAEFSGGTSIGSSGAVLEIAGDLIQSGGAVLTMTGANRGTFKMDGTTAQSITGNFDGSNSIGNLTINNSSSTGVTIASGSGNRVRVNNLLTLTDGILYTDVPALTDPIVPEEMLILSSAATVSGASASSHVDGVIKKENLATSASFNFPVGDNNFYAPVSINNPSVVTNWTVMYRKATPPRRDFIAPEFDNEISKNEYWVLDGEASGVTAKVSVTYGSQSGVTNAIGLVLALLKDLTAGSGFDNETWSRVEANNSSSNNNAGTVSTTNPISFSTDLVTLGEQLDNALPVKLVFFKGVIEDSKVKLIWQTVSELNNSHFEIERSIDGTNFEKIGKVAGNGTSSSVINYVFRDNQVNYGLIYYRLKQVDFDGKYEYSPIIAVVNNAKSTFEVRLFPNPARLSDMIVLWTSEDQVTPLYYQIIGMDGKVHSHQVIESTDFSSSFGLVSDAELQSGIYVLHIRQGNNAKILRLVLKE